VGPSSSDIAERKLLAAHDALMKTRGLQFDFKATPEPPPPPDWIEKVFRFLGELGPIFQFIFWAGLVLGGVLIVWFIAREIMATRRGLQNQRITSVTDWRPEPAAARALLEEADRLAEAGRHGEAIHLLLYRSIDDFGARRPGSVRPALTSRDIASLPTMPETARDAFTRIAEAVERNVFGGRPVAAGDFARCRSDYEAFAFSEGWS
jgi:hypothetical protein